MSLVLLLLLLLLLRWLALLGILLGGGGVRFSGLHSISRDVSEHEVGEEGGCCSIHSEAEARSGTSLTESSIFSSAVVGFSSCAMTTTDVGSNMRGDMTCWWWWWCCAAFMTCGTAEDGCSAPTT